MRLENKLAINNNIDNFLQPLAWMTTYVKYKQQYEKWQYARFCKNICWKQWEIPLLLVAPGPLFQSVGYSLQSNEARHKVSIQRPNIAVVGC